MSIEAISWALNHAPIPRDRRDASSLAIVLVGLANHADPEGRNAFPAVSRLARYTRLSERSVQYALRALEELNLIRPSDPAIVAAHIKRGDRRPKGWDLAIRHGVQTLHPADVHGVQTQPHGVQTARPRGAELAPETSFNRPENHPAREHAREDDPCGQCDARPGEPISARQTTNAQGRSVKCPRCHPHALAVAQ
ncbi:hypothetical protein GCM10010174_82460 [Kutzneria viridogrisea]|uniref:Helix-turn-helix domain-containing protein n=1 Tax=Kutzneria viridogrisea TaxID=47990 RepID=A0ABR6BF38_9PSEU|nr:hypothetical protein [Kutzneria viridogrisea]